MIFSNLNAGAKYCVLTIYNLRNIVNVRIEQSWKEALGAEWEAPYFGALTAFVSERYRAGRVYPPGSRIFAAFDSCPFDQVKVVILGQDPYHGPGQANGLCFSVNPGIPFPPSLLNIFKEIHDDTGAPIAGRPRECYCSTPRSPSTSIRPDRIRATAGRPSPTM